MDYSFAGKRKTFALGVLPQVSLRDARDCRYEARKILATWQRREARAAEPLRPKTSVTAGCVDMRAG